MKIFEGIIVSTGMKNTAVVELYRKTPHPIYKKLIKRSKKFKADNRGFEEAGVGTLVQITETRPISKDKHFKITKIVGQREIINEKPETTVSLKETEVPADAKALEGKQKESGRKVAKSAKPVKKVVRKIAKKEAK
ncbi:MAG: 30S ribosomal protein S17 [Candidatus Levybacteria bacterium]|nr:30S ribosomal protein S17 [Candidatus Levybacteria bacterium]